MKNIRFVVIVFFILLVGCSYEEETQEYMLENGWEYAPKRCHEVARTSIASAKGSAVSKTITGLFSATEEVMTRDITVTNCICDETPDSEMCEDARSRFKE